MKMIDLLCVTGKCDNRKFVEYDQFFSEYQVGNKPALFCQCLTSDWPCHSQWRHQNDNINVDALNKYYGDFSVPTVSNISSYESRHDIMLFKNYLNYFSSYTVGQPIVYMKDLHFDKIMRNREYHVPFLFADDWVKYCFEKESLQSPFNGDDYHFMYLGVASSWTPFHADVLATHSWSTNICGEKLWYFVPPSNESFFAQDGHLISDIRVRSDLFTSAGVLTVTQKSGETIFVPSNWHHQVHNEKATLSINANWLNSSNGVAMARYIVQRAQSAYKELVEFGFTDEELFVETQKLLKVDAALDLNSLCRIVDIIATARDNRRQYLKKDVAVGEKILDLVSTTLDSMCNCNSKRYLSAFIDIVRNKLVG